MRPATGNHVLRHLREFLELQQDEFSVAIHLSKSMLQKLENEKKPLSRRVAEDIAAYSGISADWLMRNDPTTATQLIDRRGRPYTPDHYKLAQIRRLDPDLP